MRYFAYGPNVNPEVLARKGLTVCGREPARLPDHRLRFNKRSLRQPMPDRVGFANIEPAPGEVVEGVLYTVPDGDLPSLDLMERFPHHYERVVVTVQTPQGPVQSVTYRARPEVRADGLLPSQNYVSHLLAAGDLFSPAYRARLERVRTFGGECAACHRATELHCHREGDLLFLLCGPCLEAARIWGDVLGRPLRVLDVEAVMQHLLRTGRAYSSFAELLAEVTALGLIADVPAPRN